MKYNRENFSRIILSIGIFFILLNIFANISYWFSPYYILSLGSAIFLLLFYFWVIVPYLLFYFVFFKFKKLNNISLFTGGGLMVLADIYTNYVYFTSVDGQAGFIFFISPIYLMGIMGIGFLGGYIFSRFQRSNK